MASEPPSTPPGQRFKNPDLTRDERLQVQILRNLGMSYEQIVAQLGLTYNQVGHACRAPNITPVTGFPVPCSNGYVVCLRLCIRHGV
ncbi:hypothetical protein N657DRAFT_649626 [Parathielavia appendiculata]|uniref:Uncharacterized protein n=1 Tax=Parathielavia appendiculata TaxID=2587402 RepID=A0AAN6TT95_9PEZI|nr:hypothetical protein N657DRAFT_649626 [Parathielavia appendiculata]